MYNGYYGLKTLKKLEEVVLYDVSDLVIRPATKDNECSMVELMACKEQSPDYFVRLPKDSSNIILCMYDSHHTCLLSHPLVSSAIGGGRACCR